mgnify:FL=1
MSAFDKIIGYQTIKEELLQICDMIHNREIYENLGAKQPQGILLYGDPGLGKSLMAKSFITESGLPAYIVRRDKGSDDFIGKITDTFEKAKKNAPAIVLLDDMDKFANEDDRHIDAEEYVAVQAGIDEVKGCNVFVFATVNEIRKLPRSLIRSGRFDRKIEVNSPTDRDAEEIIKYYLAEKKVSDNVNMDDLVKMVSYGSCAELETILNEAAIGAAYARKEKIEMDDLVKSVLRMQYDAPDNFTKKSSDALKEIALHEAGHIVVSEILTPGSVGLASLRTAGRDSTGGFIHRCMPVTRRAHHILISLAGKAAVELYYSGVCASGCQSDIRKAANNIRDAISESGTGGFGMIDVANHRFPESSESFNSRNESVVHAELERYMFKAREILIKNRDFLEKAAQMLSEKETLLYSDIRKLRESIKITEVVL